MNKKKFFFIVILGFLLFSGQVCRRAQYDLGVWKSEDGGENFQQKIMIGKKKALSSQEVLSLAIDPLNSNNIYIGTKGKGIFKSQDGANQWQKTSMSQGEVTSIVINPEDPNILYAASYLGEIGKIYKSEDGGGKFVEIYSETHSGIPVYTLAIDSYDTRKIWAGTSAGAALKSEDSGRNWVVKKWFDDEVTQIVLSTLDTRHVIVGTRSRGLFKTEDGGKTWKDINDTYVSDVKEIESRDKLRVHHLVFDQREKGTVYFASTYQLLKSKDEGKTWRPINLLIKPGEASITRLAIDPLDSQKIYLGLDTTIYKSEDGGKNWKVKKITTGRITAIALDQSDPTKIYVGARKAKQ